MKSMAHIYHRQQAYAHTKAGQRMGRQEADNIIRKNYAMVLKVLHDEFGFGPGRLLRFMDVMEQRTPSANQTRGFQREISARDDGDRWNTYDLLH